MNLTFAFSIFSMRCLAAEASFSAALTLLCSSCHCNRRWHAQKSSQKANVHLENCIKRFLNIACIFFCTTRKANRKGKLPKQTQDEVFRQEAASSTGNRNGWQCHHKAQLICNKRATMRRSPTMKPASSGTFNPCQT